MSTEEYERLTRLAHGGDRAAAARVAPMARRRGDWSTYASLIRLAPGAVERVWTNSVDDTELIWIPAGKFQVGSQNATISMAAFGLARHPVTNAQWARFVEATEYAPAADHPEPERYLAHWEGASSPPAELAAHPVVHVSWYDAMAYCAWAGLTLPTEWMWEKAARGTDGRPWPWGNKPPRAELCNLGMTSGTRPVGSYPRTRTAWGCQDMIGNVSEWCQRSEDRSALSPLPSASNGLTIDAAVPGVGRRREPVRGSAFLRTLNERRTRAAHRRELSATRRNRWVGFRPALWVEDAGASD